MRGFEQRGGGNVGDRADGAVEVLVGQPGVQLAESSLEAVLEDDVAVGLATERVGFDERIAYCLEQIDGDKIDNVLPQFGREVN